MLKSPVGYVTRFVGLTFLLVISSHVAAQVRCDNFENNAAFLRVRTWSDLKAWNGGFGHCDDASVGELVSDFVTHRLATAWDLREFERVFGRATPDWVWAVNATSDMKELRQILVNANTKCPRASARLCRQLAMAAQQAIDEEAAASNPK